MLHNLCVLSIFTLPVKLALAGLVVPFSPVTTTEYVHSFSITSTLELYIPPNLSFE